MKKKLILIGVLAILVVGVMGGCTSKGSKKEEKSKGEKPSVALVVNQRFGDNSASDFIAEGVKKAEKDFGVEIKLFESTSPSNHEEDIRAMAKEGYDLILTTFAFMSDATKTVALEYPDTKFGAIFQRINSKEGEYPNIWDIEFFGQEAMYINGYMAGKYTKSNKVGLVIGAEEPSPNAEGNGFMRGVKDANPEASVEFAFVGSYEDPAKAKEIASAMIAKGCDILQTDSAASDTGVVEASKESDIPVMSVITDYTELYPTGFAGVIEMDFQGVSYDAIKLLVEDKFPGGEHGVRDLSNKGYYIAWDVTENFAKDNAKYTKDFTEIIKEAKEVESKILNGDLVIEFDHNVPNWERVKGL